MGERSERNLFTLPRHEPGIGTSSNNRVVEPWGSIFVGEAVLSIGRFTEEHAVGTEPTNIQSEKARSLRTTGVPNF